MAKAGQNLKKRIRQEQDQAKDRFVAMANGRAMVITREQYEALKAMGAQVGTIPNDVAEALDRKPDGAA